MRAGGCGVATVHALHGQAVTGEGVIRPPGNELFQHLAAGFLLFRHWVVSYYTDSPSGVQPDAGARGWNEAEKRKQARGRDGAVREAGERVEFRDDGNRPAGADESAGEITWRTGDAPRRHGSGVG